MLGKVVIENGTKKIQALTADTGVGAPVGSYLYLEKKSNPQGYLYCDGSTFDETVYPALYQYLGTNVLPDWRELGAKGAEKNTTLIFDSTETDPSTGQAGTQNHDVFTQGEFKDDALQKITGTITVNANSQDGSYITGASGALGTDEPYSATSDFNNAWSNPSFGKITLDSSRVTRNDPNANVTRGKSRAVFIYIKATSGLTENQQENVLNTINENLSYSTTEHKTGKKWIDGKPIYENTIIQNLEGANPFTGRVDVTHGIANIHTPIRIVTAKANSQSQGDNWNMAITIPAKYDNATFAELGQFTPTTVSLFAGTSNWTSLNRLLFVLEYTKTTD